METDDDDDDNNNNNNNNAEMKYMRRTAGYTWTDHKTNTKIAKELKITQILDEVQEKLDTSCEQNVSP